MNYEVINNFIMETFDVKEFKDNAYRLMFMQRGSGDHFMSAMSGEGLGNYFGTSVRKTIPLHTRPIKGNQTKKKSVVTTTGKRKANSGKSTVLVHKHHKRVKWPNL